MNADRYATLKRHPFHPHLWVVWHEFTWRTVHVPQGFPTDFASIPKLLQWLFSTYGHYLEATIIHDYLYAQGSQNRKLHDQIFLEAMRDYGVQEWKAKLFYYAVRLFGNQRRSQRDFKRHGLLKVYPNAY